MQAKRTQGPKVAATMLSASVLTLFLVGLSSFPQLAAASTASNLAAVATTALNPVQLSIQPKNATSVSSYDLVAYNSSGTPVASYTGQYPRVTLDLPSGTYLFAAVANGPAPAQSMVCCMCAQSGAATTSSPPALKTNSGPSAIAFPCYGGNQPLEYGYSLTQVSGSTSVTIDTQPPSGFPTTDVSVSVSYKNGTAVSGADVSASAVGGYLSWGDNSKLSMYAQTSANGVAQLVVPAVPLTVTASESVQVNLTQSEKTVQVNVGGQPVNVTVYYSPNYVYLSASALLIPPQTSLSMVLSAQTQYPPILYGAGSASSASTPNSSQVQPGAQGAAVTPSDSGSTTTTARFAPIPPIPASAHASSAPAQESSQASQNPSGVTLLTIGTLALAGAVAAIVGIAISRTRR